MRGGLVNTWTTINRVPGHAIVGPLILRLFNSYFNTHAALETILFEVIGKDDVNPIELEEAVDELRLLVSRALIGGKDIDLRPIQTDQCETCVRAHIM